MDKMIVSSSGHVTITNDGVTILDEMEVEHPAAKMLVEVAKVQEAEVGDGTTTAVILAGELLSKAEDLLDKNIHPTVITKGYELAARKSQEILAKLSKNITLKDKKTLEQIAMTAMTGKNVEYETKKKLSKLAVKAVTNVIEETKTQLIIDLNDIKIEKKAGNDTENSELIEGIVIDKERVHSSMPRLVNKAKVLLLDAPIEISETEIDAKIQITSPTQMQEFVEQEERMLKEMVESIVSTGANAVFCQKGIDDVAQHYLAKNRIFATRRMKESDMKRLAKAWTASSSRPLGASSVPHMWVSSTPALQRIPMSSRRRASSLESAGPESISMLERRAPRRSSGLAMAPSQEREISIPMRGKSRRSKTQTCPPPESSNCPISG